MLRQRGRHLTEGGKKLLKKITTQRIFLCLPAEARVAPTAVRTGRVMSGAQFS